MLALVAAPQLAGAQEPAPALERAAPASVATADANADAEASARAEAEADTIAAALSASSAEASADLAVASAEEFKLNIYGFTDFTYTHRLSRFPFVSPYPTFMVGNVNLYVGAELGGGWRSLTEFRLLYAPHGSVPTSDAFSPDAQRIDTSVGDPAEFGRPQRWGGVEIERAWLEYTFDPLLTIQCGQWLTPYGIWNVDHGSPVIIGVRRPFVVGEALIPERQTGIQIYGSYLFGTSEVGYNLGLSNGRGPVDAYMDLDRNKAVTARLFLTNESAIGTVTVGGTIFRGRYTDRFTRLVIAPAGGVGINYISRARYEELSLATDLRYVWQNLTLQGELMVRDAAYDDRVRPVAVLAVPGVPPGFSPDYRSVGWYVMGAYRLPWYNIMPFFGGEKYDPGVATNFKSAGVWGGLNVRPTPRVVLKGQFTRAWSTDDAPTVGDNWLDIFDLQAAWSF